MGLVTWSLKSILSKRGKYVKKKKSGGEGSNWEEEKLNFSTKLSIYQIAIFQPLYRAVVIHRPSQLGLEGQLGLSAGRQPTAHFTPIEEFPNFYCILSPS